MKITMSFLKPYRKQCVLIIFITLVDVAGSLLVPSITAGMINSAVSGGTLFPIVRKGFVMLAISVASGMLTLLGSKFCALLSANLGRDLRGAIYDKSLKFSSADFEKFGTASMITRTLNDVSVVQQAFVSFIQAILPVPMICIMGIIMSFGINGYMGVIILCGTFFVLSAALLIMRKATAIFDKLQRYLDRMNVVVRENITGVRVIRAFNKEQHETKRMKNTFKQYAESSVGANYLFAGLDCLATVVINIVIVVIMYVGGNQVGVGNMKIGDITAVSEYAIWILLYVMMAQMTIIMLPRALTCVGRLSEVLAYVPEICDGSQKLSSVESDDVVSFKNVSFCFEDADEKTLSDLTFTCRKGETTAIIGETGSGKSTVIKLLLRYYDATDGEITLFGQNIRNIPQRDIRNVVSYVPQKAWLFSGTVAENLRYGNPEATKEDLIKALHIAQSDFVFDLPLGIESFVAQGGTNFSGGQKQRICIARALAKKAELYVFDDSFSALDFKTDAALRKTIAEELKNSAVLIVAQRISTIMHADKIIVLSNGKIVGDGRHEELIKNCPTYINIVNSQMKGESDNGRNEHGNAI